MPCIPCATAGSKHSIPARSRRPGRFRAGLAPARLPDLRSAHGLACAQPGTEWKCRPCSGKASALWREIGERRIVTVEIVEGVGVVGRLWTAGFAGMSRPDPGPGTTAFWLKTPSGLLACQGLDRIGRTSWARAESVALAALLKAAHRHRASPLLIHGAKPKDEGAARLAKGLRVEFAGTPDADARVLALSMFPDPPSFESGGLRLVGESVYVAYGTRDYYVDVLLGTCTCPAFSFGHRPCKHLEAARRLRDTVIGERRIV